MKAASASALLLSLSLCACVTTAGYEKRLATWVGKEEIALVRLWGPPSQTYQVGGKRFLVYAHTRQEHVSGAMPTVFSNVKGDKVFTTFTPGTPDTVVTKSCTTSFELSGNRIVAWSHRGDDCKARE